MKLGVLLLSLVLGTTNAFSTKTSTKPSYITIGYSNKVATSTIHHRSNPGDFAGRIGGRSSSFDVVASRMDATTTGTFPSALVHVCSFLKIDLDRMAKAGISFGISYSIISNINGSLSLSLAWYLASKKTALSPLAPGQWKSLLAAYGGLYAFITLLRPIRVMGAAALSNTTTMWIDNIQRRMECSQGTAAVVLYAIGLVAWMMCLTCGITLASTCSGVPLW